VRPSLGQYERKKNYVCAGVMKESFLGKKGKTSRKQTKTTDWLNFAPFLPRVCCQWCNRDSSLPQHDQSVIQSGTEECKKEDENGSEFFLLPSEAAVVFPFRSAPILIILLCFSFSYSKCVSASTVNFFSFLRVFPDCLSPCWLPHTRGRLSKP